MFYTLLPGCRDLKKKEKNKQTKKNNKLLSLPCDILPEFFFWKFALFFFFGKSQ